MLGARSLVGTAVLLGRCLLISILIATLVALHVLSAEVGLNSSAVTSVTTVERSTQHSVAATGPRRPAVAVTPDTGSTTTAEVAATSSTVEPGMNTGALLQCQDAGNCVLFPAAGVAIMVLLLMAGMTARALRRHHHIAAHWTRAAASISSRRGPPLPRRPRIALCVIRV